MKKLIFVLIFFSIIDVQAACLNEGKVMENLREYSKDPVQTVLPPHFNYKYGLTYENGLSSAELAYDAISNEKTLTEVHLFSIDSDCKIHLKDRVLLNAFNINSTNK